MIASGTGWAWSARPGWRTSWSSRPRSASSGAAESWPPGAGVTLDEARRVMLEATALTAPDERLRQVAAGIAARCELPSGAGGGGGGVGRRGHRLPHRRDRGADAGRDGPAPGAGRLPGLRPHPALRPAPAGRAGPLRLGPPARRRRAPRLGGGARWRTRDATGGADGDRLRPDPPAPGGPGLHHRRRGAGLRRRHADLGHLQRARPPGALSASKQAEVVEQADGTSATRRRTGTPSASLRPAGRPA